MDVNYIELGGEKRPICFSLSAIEDIQKEFGGLENMGSGLSSNNISAVDKVLGILFDAGRRYCEGVGIDCPAPLKCRPADLMDAQEAAQIVHKIYEAMQKDSSRDVEVASKN